MPVVDRDAVEKAEPETPGEVLQSEPLCELARHVQRVFQIAKNDRAAKGITDRLTAVQLMVNGEYSKNELGLIATTGAVPAFFQYPSLKVRALRSMEGDVVQGGGDKPYTLEPTPDPDMPDEVSEAAVREAMMVIVQREAAIRKLADAAANAAAAQGQDPEAARAAVLSDPDTQPLTPEQMASIMPHKVEEVKNRVKEEAQQRCALMERKIDDQFVEGGFEKAFADFCDLQCKYGTALLRGPVPRVRRRTVRKTTKDGVWQIRTEEQTVLSWEAINPFDCYPAPDARELGDGPLVLTVKFQPSDLRLFSKAKGKEFKGWNAEAVSRILAAQPQGGVELVEQDAATKEHEELSDRNPNADAEGGKTSIEALEYFGEARGSELIGIGLRKDTYGRELDAEEYYEVNCIAVQDAIVYCRILEPEIGWPLSKGVCYGTADSWWGDGPVQKAMDAFKMINSCARSLIANMSEASGPMYGIDVNRLAPGTDLKIRPHKVFPFVSPPLTAGVATPSGSPIQMIQPNSNSADLLNIYKFFKTELDDLTGIPAYTYGNNGASSAMRTASTLSMLTEAATRGVKDVILGLDRDVIRPSVMRLYAWNMLYSKDDSIKGDMQCKAGGVMALILVEQEYNRQIQFLNLSNNGTDLQIVDIQARAFIYRKIAEMLHLNPDKVVATYEQLREKQQLADIQQKLQIAQQQAALANTQAGIGGGDNGEVPTQGPSTAGPQAPVQGAPAREGPAGGGNPGGSMPSPETAASALSGGPGGGLTPSARGTIKSTITNPQARAAAGQAAANARRGA